MNENLNIAIDALKEIAKGEGAFSMDPIEHATNCIENMKSKAREAIYRITGEKYDPIYEYRQIRGQRF